MDKKEERLRRHSDLLACRKTFADFLAGEKCVASFTQADNLTVFVMLFKPFAPAKEDVYVLCRFFIFDEVLPEFEAKHIVPIRQWIDRGLVTLLLGHSPDGVWAQILKDKEQYDIKICAVDRFAMPAVKNKLQLMDIPICEVGQGFLSVSTPLKRLKHLVMAKHLRYGGNPMLEWQYFLFDEIEDPAGNIKIKRKDALAPTVGIAALCMALAQEERILQS